MTVTALSKIIQGNKESLQSYIDSFTQVIVEVEGEKVVMKYWIFENDLMRDHPFQLEIKRNEVKTT